MSDDYCQFCGYDSHRVMGLQTQLAEVTAERDALQQSIFVLADLAPEQKAERDRLQAEVERMKAERDQAFAEIQDWRKAHKIQGQAADELIASEREAKERAVGLLRPLTRPIFALRDLDNAKAFLQSLEVRADGN